jgi:hypothetical protein
MDFIFELDPEENTSIVHVNINYIKTIAEDVDFEEISEENQESENITVDDALHIFK